MRAQLGRWKLIPPGETPGETMVQGRGLYTRSVGNNPFLPRCIYLGIPPREPPRIPHLQTSSK